MDERGKVLDFHKKFKRTWNTEPTVLTEESRQWRARMVLEEALEVVEALGCKVATPSGPLFSYHVFNAEEQKTVELVDALCDLRYVTLGTEVALGIDTRMAFIEVHRSNMTKEVGEEEGDAKLVKPEGWEPPDIVGALKMCYPNADQW